MLVYEAAQVIGAQKQEPKPWEMNGRSGVSHTAKLAVVSSTMEAVTITLKAKSEEELTKKVAAFTPGKPAKIQIKEITPVFRQGDRKPTGYEFTA